MQTSDTTQTGRASGAERVLEAGRGEVRARFCTPNAGTEWRVRTLFTKEPETIEWIDTFAPGELLLDVGANVGMYSVWAARARRVRVVALEPESQNYALLNHNVFLNALGDLVAAYCVAASDRDGFDFLYLSSFLAGESCHSFGASTGPDGRPMRAGFRQGSVAARVDSLVAGGVVGVPDHVKIDVDGIEPRVVAGAGATLRDRRVKSVLIEINTNLDAHWEIIDAMLAAGFDYSQAQVDRSQRRDGPFAGTGNYVFRR